MAELAYELDDNGCPIEPSERVREAAVRTMCICCPGGPADVEYVEPTPARETPDDDGITPDDIPQPLPDGEHVLFTTETDLDSSVAVLSLVTGKHRLL